MNHKETKVIVTGASGGIGRAVALRFLREGAAVLAIARSETELNALKEAARREGFSLATHRADVSREADVQSVMTEADRLWKGSVEVLVNAAGIYGPKNLLEETAPNEWMETIAVNLFGTMLMTRAVLPAMKKEKRGSIITFSGGGEGAFPRLSAYAASKGGVVRFTESMADEVKEFGICINAIAPGAVNSRLLDEALAAGKEKVGSAFYAKLLKQKKEGGVSPDRAAELCLFLASPAARSITGKILSAVWDDWKNLPKHLKELQKTDIYNWRRIKPKDRGYDW